MAKIISFSSGKKQLPLSSLMVVALLEACKKQHAGIPYGPGDIKGSFTYLISRGLIIKKAATIESSTKSTWQVTIEAIELLKTMGIKVAY